MRALFALVCLCASAPPGWFPGAGLLVLPGWMAFYAMGERVRRPLLLSYLVGVGHLLVFSVSLRHVAWGAVVAIAVLGGLYYLLTTWLTRSIARFLPGSLAFGLTLAAACWLRAHIPDLYYPHAQPVHCLYHWPVLLGSVRWGSEIFGNMLIGMLAAALVDLYRSWHGARPGWRRSVWMAGGTGAVILSTVVFPGSAPSGDQSVRISLLEPRLQPEDFRPFNEDPDAALRRMRVIEPTRALVAGGDPPDLMVWPESVEVLPGERASLDLPTGTRLLAGDVLRDSSGSRVIAVLTDDRGRQLGYHEKQRLVAGGERVPYLDWLPEDVVEWIRELFEAWMNQPLPDTQSGAPRPLLETADGVPFGALICFDNAFPEVSEDMVRRGARFLVVISNESWYRGGDELAQMEAMTVCRALECGVPLVRCTVDGATLVVNQEGRVVDRLPSDTPHETGPGFLTVDLMVSATGPPALPWLHPLIRWIVLFGVLLGFGSRILIWCRLLSLGFQRGSAA